jgi:hypothetical protein
VPDSYGKRQRDAVKARKAAEREERRLARRRRRDGLEVAPWEVEDQATEAVASDDAGTEDEAGTDPANSHEDIDAR